MGLKWFGEWKCSFGKGLKAEAFLSAGYDFSYPEGRLKRMGAQEKYLKAWDRETEPSKTVQSKFLVTSPVRRLLDLTTDVALQTVPVASPFPPRIVSAFLSIPQLPPPATFQESSRHKSKESACTKVHTGRGLDYKKGKAELTDNQLQFAFLLFLFGVGCFFFFTTAKWPPPYFSSSSSFFFFFKEKEFSAI